MLERNRVLDVLTGVTCETWARNDLLLNWSKTVNTYYYRGIDRTMMKILLKIDTASRSSIEGRAGRKEKISRPDTRSMYLRIR